MPANSEPKVAFVLFTYNQENYVSEAIRGALSQSYHPLTIVISDDSSVDRTFERANEAVRGYRGSHEIECVQTPRNLGFLGHINYVVSRLTADIFVLAAGDDISIPSRVASVVDVFCAAPDAMAVCSDWVLCGHSRAPTGGYAPNLARIPLLDIVVAGGGTHTGATYAYRRECLIWPEPLPASLANEDRVLPLRAALLGNVYVLSEALVNYRSSGNRDKKINKKRKLALFREDHINYIDRTLRFAADDQRIGRRYSKMLLFALRMNAMARRLKGENSDKSPKITNLVTGKAIAVGLRIAKLSQRRHVASLDDPRS